VTSCPGLAVDGGYAGRSSCQPGDANYSGRGPVGSQHHAAQAAAATAEHLRVAVTNHWPGLSLAEVRVRASDVGHMNFPGGLTTVRLASPGHTAPG
jgi:hypothetical protein